MALPQGSPRSLKRLWVWLTEREQALENPVLALLPTELGTAGQVLAVNEDADGLEWVTPEGGA